MVFYESIKNNYSESNSPLSMILMRDGRTKKRHDPVACKLIYRALILVDLAHQDFKAAVHNLVDFFRVELFGH